MEYFTKQYMTGPDGAHRRAVYKLSLIHIYMCIRDRLQGFEGEFYRVGDCDKVGNALKAFHSGYELADQI